MRARNARSGTLDRKSRPAPDAKPPQARQQPQTDRTVAILIAILIGTPLAILPARVPTYDTSPKLVVLCLGAALLFWFRNRWWPGLRKLWQTRPGRWFCLFLIGTAGSLVLSGLFSGQVWVSLTGTAWRRLGAIDQAIMLAVAAAIAARVYIDRTIDQTNVRTLMLAMEAAGAIASAYAILQYAGCDPLIPASVYTLGLPPTLRPPATLTQATYFATFLLAPISVALWFRFHETSWRWKRAHEAALCLTISALVLSGTRSALLGLVVGASILPYTESSRLRNWKSLAKAGLIVLAIAAALAAFVLSPPGKPVRARVAQWTADPAGGPRLLVWRDSLRLLAEHPILGIGPERFEGEFRRIESLELARAFPDHYAESPHNFFFEVGIAQGLIGLATWVALLGLACWSGFNRLRYGQTEAAPVCAALIAMLISLQFCPLTLTNELFLLTLSAISVALAAPELALEPGRMAPNQSWTIWSRATAVLFVLAAWAYAEQARLYYLAQTRASQRDLAASEQSYVAARQFPMPGPDLALSQYVATLARKSAQPARSEAFTMAEQAAEVAERKSADRFNGSYQAAMVRMSSGELRQAETKLRAAFNAAPTWYRPRMALASVLWWEGRNQEAQQAADAALNCAGRMQPNVQRTLQTARAQASLIAAHRSR